MSGKDLCLKTAPDRPLNYCASIHGRSSYDSKGVHPYGRQDLLPEPVFGSKTGSRSRGTYQLKVTPISPPYQKVREESDRPWVAFRAASYIRLRPENIQSLPETSPYKAKYLVR